MNSDYKDRCSKASRGEELNILINDENPLVRHEVAMKRYRLDKLVKDVHPYVRCAVARQQYNLEELVTDVNWEVRFEVAMTGRYFKELKNDEEKVVRLAAMYREMLNRPHDYNLLLAILDVVNYFYEDRGRLDYLNNQDKNWKYRVAMVEKENIVDDMLKNDSNEYIREAIVRQHINLSWDNCARVRKAMAEQGFNLYEFSKDNEWIVRREVALSGFDLINDESILVKLAVLERKHNLTYNLELDDVIKISKELVEFNIIENDSIENVKDVYNLLLELKSEDKIKSLNKQS